MTTRGTLYFFVCCPFGCVFGRLSLISHCQLKKKKKRIVYLFLINLQSEENNPITEIVELLSMYILSQFFLRALKNQVHIEKGTNALFIELIQLIE